METIICDSISKAKYVLFDGTETENYVPNTWEIDPKDGSKFRISQINYGEALAVDSIVGDPIESLIITDYEGNKIKYKLEGSK